MRRNTKSRRKKKHNIHRRKSQLSILFKLGVSEVVNKDSQTIHVCLDSMKAFLNLGFNKGCKIGESFL